ncbi:hypothetical protein ElyMa_005505100 [Elysia marginata]|uniref:Uncharacterized protein n=1 Tax=Elysia marginata TaxID=1093978 RepID=A0AAV4EU09_9GAST|nr:hypothetical protein ElyMa_005505100 [Elysia marginata]
MLSGIDDDDDYDDDDDDDNDNDNSVGAGDDDSDNDKGLTTNDIAVTAAAAGGDADDDVNIENRFWCGNISCYTPPKRAKKRRMVLNRLDLLHMTNKGSSHLFSSLTAYILF